MTKYIRHEHNFCLLLFSRCIMQATTGLVIENVQLPQSATTLCLFQDSRYVQIDRPYRKIYNRKHSAITDTTTTTTTTDCYCYLRRLLFNRHSFQEFP